MSNESDIPKTGLSRRQLLGLVGVSGLVVGGGVVGGRYLDDGDEESPPEPSNDDPEPPADNDDDPPEADDSAPESDEEPPEPPGTDITEFGARPNPDDPDAAAARRNLEAIHEAALAAGEGGAIYVPEGTYYFGHDGERPEPNFSFGDREPGGMSIYGAGPDVSALCLTEHIDIDARSDHTGFAWTEDNDHGEFAIVDIRLDGNYDRLPGNLRENGSASRGCEMRGEGEVTLENAHIRGWHMNGCRARSLMGSARNCTFEDNGIGTHNDTEGDSISHHLSVDPESDRSVVIEDSEFHDCSGSAVNWDFGSGHVSIRDCYFTGTGANLCKFSTSGTLEMSRVVHIAHSDSLVEKLTDLGQEDNFHGRNFLQRIKSTGDGPATAIFDNVLTKDITDYAIQCREGELILRGDMLAIMNSNKYNNNEVIRNRSGGRFIDVDIDRLSVHYSDGVVFDTPGSRGRVSQLNARGNYGVGTLGDIEVDDKRTWASPLLPSGPSLADVGTRVE